MLTNIVNHDNQGSVSPLKLLVVDDDISIRGLIREVFMFDYQIIEAEDVKSAITKLKENQIAVSLIDYNMPNQSGMALLEIMEDEFPLTRKVMITGNKEKSLVIEAINTGKVHAFVNKPFDIDKLDSILKEQVEFYRQERANHNKILEYDDLIELYNNQIANVNSTLIETLVKENENEISINHIITVIKEIKNSIINILDTDADQSSDEFKRSFHQYLSRISSIVDNLSKEYQLEILEFFSYFNKIIMAQLLERSHLSRKYAKTLQRIRKENEFLMVYDNILTNLVLDSDPVELMIEFLQIDITDSLRAETLKKHNVPYPKISFVVIMKNDLPIYSYQDKSSTVDTYLISNFFVAANVFAQEFFDSNSVNTILMDRYIIIFRRVTDDILYVVQADYETIQLRMNIEIFIERSIDSVSQIQPNIGVSTEQTDQIGELCQELVVRG